MTVDIERFLASDEVFALRFGRDDLPGLWSKRLRVPDGHRALVRDSGGEDRILEAGAETADVDKGVLVKTLLVFDVGSLGASKDELEFSARVGVELRAGDAPLDLRQLERELLREPEISRESAVAYFEPYVREALRFFIAQRPGVELATADLRQALEDHLREELKKALFETGLVLADVLHPAFDSDAWEAKRRASAHANAQAEAIEHEREILEMRKQLDRRALLADIELRDEADRTRKERRLAQYEQIRTKLGDDDLKALVMMLDDDKQRATLIRELIDKDLTPEQRAGVKVSDMEARVEERLVELQQRLAQLTGEELSARETDPITRRVLCVVGKRVLAFDPKTNLHPEVPKEVYETEDGGLGYLRSVRSEVIDSEDYLLLGAQRGVYRINGAIRHEYPFPCDPEGKGGANAVAHFDGRLFATHSEVGLVEWPSEPGRPGRVLIADRLRGAGSVRGATVVDGHLYFSVGAEVYSLDVATGSETPVRFKGSDDSITAFLVHRNELVAGNKNGRIYRWSLDDPNSPEAFNVLKKNPIFMLRHTQIAGQGFYVIGSKEFTVSVAEPRKDLFREYQAREEVRWVDGAGDYIVGVSRSGYKVFCWDALRQTEPKLTIRVSDKVQDLFLQKTLPAKA